MMPAILLRRSVLVALGLLASVQVEAQNAVEITPWCASPPAKSSDNGGTTPAPSAATNIFTMLSDDCLSLHQGLTGSTASQGASFSYQRQSGNTDTFQSSFALTFTPNLTAFPFGSSEGDLFVYSSVDGNLSTRANAKNSFLNVRPQLGALFHSKLADPSKPSNPANDTFVLSRFGPVFEASQDFTVQNGLFEINLTTRRDNWAMGSYQPLFGSSEVFATWLPFLDLEVGSNIKGRSTTQELTETRFRVIPQLSLLFSDSGKAAHLLGLQSISLDLDDTMTYLPLEGVSEIVQKVPVRSKQIQNLFSADLEFHLTDNASLGASYTTGASAPFFKHADTILITFKIGFGTSLPTLLPSPQAAAKPN